MKKVNAGLSNPTVNSMNTELFHTLNKEQKMEIVNAWNEEERAEGKRKARQELLDSLKDQGKTEEQTLEEHTEEEMEQIISEFREAIEKGEDSEHEDSMNDSHAQCWEELLKIKRNRRILKEEREEEVLVINRNNARETKLRKKLNDMLDPYGLRHDILVELGQIKGQNLEEQFEFFVREEETAEVIAKRVENQKNFRLAYEKEAYLSTPALLAGVQAAYRDEVRIMIADQAMDDGNAVDKGAGKAAAPIRVTIQKYYEFEAFSEETMQDETVKGWFNLTGKDLGINEVHKAKGTNKETGEEFTYRVAHVFEVEDAESLIKRGVNGRYDISTKMLTDNLDFNLVYQAGRFTDLVMLNGYEYRMVVQHSMLGEIVGLDYEDDKTRRCVGLDGYADRADWLNQNLEREEDTNRMNMLGRNSKENYTEIVHEDTPYVQAAILLVQPKEQFAKDMNKYKDNLKDSQAEIQFGKSADVLLGTTQLFYSEWEERCAQMAEERTGDAIAFKAKVSRSAAKIKAMASPYYTVVLELNKLYKAKDYKKMMLLAIEHKENADDILTYARANKKFANLEFNKESTLPSPYTAVRKHATPVEKKVASKASLIKEDVAELVRELKKTMDKSLITVDNAKDVIKAARAGGEFRMDGEFGSLYLHARDVAQKAA